MAARIVSIVGRKNAGKTTLTVALAAHFARKRRRVMTLKHGHHPAVVDTAGTDTWRHFHEGGAERVMIAGPEQRILFERAADDYDPVALVRRHMADADIVLVEGYKDAAIPKIEVYRPMAGPPLYDPASPLAAHWLALVTDDRGFTAPVPVLNFHDTMWLQLLTAIAWERALQLDA